jgi:hypothetical protein
VLQYALSRSSVDIPSHLMEPLMLWTFLTFWSYTAFAFDLSQASAAYTLPDASARHTQVAPDLLGPGQGCLVVQGRVPDPARPFDLLGGVWLSCPSVSTTTAYAAFLGAEWFGATAAVGDLDGDGQLDLAVGDDDAQTGGAVHVFFGPIAPGVFGPADADATFLPTPDNTILGASLAIADDLTGDGVSDLVVGDPGWPVGRTAPIADGLGALWVLPGARWAGPIVVDQAPGQVMITGRLNTTFPSSIHAIDDLDLDGLTDLVVSPDCCAFEALMLGSRTLGTPGDAWAKGTALRYDAGEAELIAFGGASDLDQDGLPDLVFSTPASSVRRGITGAVVTLTGASPWAPGAAINLATAAGGFTCQRAPCAIEAAYPVGDFNGDGRSELSLVFTGAPPDRFTPPERRLGVAILGPRQLLPGLHRPAVAPLASTPGVTPIQILGGDLDSDGAAELIVSSITDAAPDDRTFSIFP